MERESHHSPAEELIAMRDIDQEMRANARHDRSKWDFSVDERNSARFKEIVAKIGWPTVSKVGAEASHAAWLLVQHTPNDPDFMKQCLELMKQAPENEVRLIDIVYLEDRIRTMENRPQIYGTQFYMKDGEWQPLPIEDPEHVDELRASIGLGPIAEYIEMLKREYGTPG